MNSAENLHNEAVKWYLSKGQLDVRPMHILNFYNNKDARKFITREKKLTTTWLDKIEKQRKIQSPQITTANT